MQGSFNQRWEFWVIWTNQVSLAEALKLQKLLPWTIHTGQWRRAWSQTNLRRRPASSREALGLARTDTATRPSKAEATVRKRKEGEDTSGEKQRRLGHFWHFNIKTMTSGNDSKAKRKIIKDQYLTFPSTQVSHWSSTPISPRSTTELKIYFKAPKPVQTLSKARAQPELSPLSGPSERRVPGKAPRNSRRAAQRRWRARAEGAWRGSWGGGHSLCTDAGKGDVFCNPNYLVAQPSQRDKRVGITEQGPEPPKQTKSFQQDPAEGGVKGWSPKGLILLCKDSLRNALFTAGWSISNGNCWQRSPSSEEPSGRISNQIHGPHVCPPSPKSPLVPRSPDFHLDFFDS